MFITRESEVIMLSTCVFVCMFVCVFVTVGFLVPYKQFLAGI